MSFKQKNKDNDRLWRKQMREELMAAGLPDLVIDDDRKWNYVLLHGDDELESGWNLSWIDNPQAEKLLSLLRTQFGASIGYDLIALLERRLRVEKG